MRRYHTHRNSTLCSLQSAVSSLSTGPVAPSDMVGGSDVDLIMKACMADGTLLQPHTPAMAIDAQFIQSAFGSGSEGGKEGREGEIDRWVWGGLSFDMC